MAPMLFSRNVSSPTISPLTTDLLIALLALAITILLATTALLVLRRYRRAKKLATMNSEDDLDSPSAYKTQFAIANDDLEMNDKCFECSSETPTVPPQRPESPSIASPPKQSKFKPVRKHQRSKSKTQITFRGDASGARNSVSSLVYESRLDLIRNSSAPPPAGGELPELRITFPDEVDEQGVSRGGRVVVVRVGEKGYGLEPLDGGEVQMMDMGRTIKEKV